MSCPNCNRTFRAGGNGLAFHLTWCKPAQPAADPVAVAIVAVDDAWQALTPAQRDAIRHPAPAPVPVPTSVVARAPRGRKLTRKARAAFMRAEIRAALLRNLTRLDVHAAGLLVSCRHTGCAVDSDAAAEYHRIAPVVAPTVRKVAGPKLPAVGAGKHARCVAHIPMVRTAPGVAYACFDVTPDADAIAERQAFVDVLDGAWNVQHVAYLARLAPEPTDAARAFVGKRLMPDYTSRVMTGAELAERREFIAAEVAEHNARYGYKPHNAVAYSVAA